MTKAEGRGDRSARAGRLAALIVGMAGGKSAVRPEDRARIEEVCKQVLREDAERPEEAPALPAVLEAIRARPELSRLSRALEEARWTDDPLAIVVLADETPAAGGEPVHGLGDDTVVLNVEGLDDPRQLQAVADAARAAAAGPDAKGVAFIGAEELQPRMRAELVAALFDYGGRGADRPPSQRLRTWP